MQCFLFFNPLSKIVIGRYAIVKEKKKKSHFSREKKLIVYIWRMTYTRMYKWICSWGSRQSKVEVLLSFSNFSILFYCWLLPQKRCLVISHSQKIFSCFLIASFSQTIAPSRFGNLKYSTVLTLYLIFTLGMWALRL